MELTGFHLDIKQEKWIIPAIIAFRSLSGLGLKESKDVLDWVRENRRGGAPFRFNVPRHMVCSYESLQTPCIDNTEVMMLRSFEEFTDAPVPPHLLPTTRIQSLEEKIDALNVHIDELKNDLRDALVERHKDLRLLATIVQDCEQIPVSLLTLAEEAIEAYENTNSLVFPLTRSTSYSWE